MSAHEDSPHTEPAITPEIVARHGLKPDEYARFVALRSIVRKI
jgi:hypothetical protein